MLLTKSIVFLFIAWSSLSSATTTTPEPRTPGSLCRRLSLPEENGWCVFQKHQTKPDWSHQSMNKSWIEYKHGFGNYGGDTFWGGLEKIRTLTTSGERKFRIEWTGEISGYLEYDGFYIAPESDRYRFHLGKRTGGTLSDIFFGKCGSRDYSAYRPIGHQFVTYDHDLVCQPLGNDRFKCEPAKSGERGHAATWSLGWWIGGYTMNTRPNYYDNGIFYCSGSSYTRVKPSPKEVKMMVR